MSRRLVQSTLFGYKSPDADSKVQQKITELDGEDSDGDDEDFCGSQGKVNGRKRKGKVTPQKRAPKKPKETKSPANSKPTKNGASNGKILNNQMKSEDASPPIPNLRLEAKLTAEENSQMYAGREIHPFFSSLKVGKRNQETAEVATNCCSFEQRDKNISIGPIHVFERMQDEVVVLDWKNWTFCEKSSIDMNCSLGDMSTSVFASCVEASHFSLSHHSDASVDQNKIPDQFIIEDDLYRTLPAIPAALRDEDIASCQHIKDSEGDCQVDEIVFISGHVYSEHKSGSEQQSRVLPKSNQPDDTLWTVKYQPRRANEVCGNNEAVKFLSDWLHLWHERDVQSIKDSSKVDKCNVQDDDDDYECCQYDSDSANINGEDSLKNVLLVTGPVGCGKSAAIHACAKEQGFQVLESNASDCRNGAVLKQQFGEALGSHCLTRSLEGHVTLHSKHITKSSGTLPNAEARQQFDCDLMEIIPISDEVSHDSVGTSGNHVCNDSEIASAQVKVKSLILFEDVDIIFPEDRGFVGAIKQIAENAKGPVILTSNNNNPDLPNNLDRLELCFTMPSLEELLPQLYKVCAAEKTNIQPHLIEQLTKHCQGDIRKTVMHLQFWFQSKRYRKGREKQNMFGPLLFNIEAAHWLLPNFIPWDFPSQLSELVEKEISRSLFMMEENPTLIEAIKEGGGTNKRHNGLEINNNKIDNLEAKKEAMLRRNFSLPDLNETINPSDTACEFSNSSGTFDFDSFTPQKCRRKLDVVVSSDSEDECFNKGSSDKNRQGDIFLEKDRELLSQSPTMQNCMNPLTDELLCSEAEKFDNRSYQCPQTENGLCMDTYISVDISCVPESTFVPETEIDDGMELLSRTMSCVNVAEVTEVSVSNEFKRRLVKCSEMLGSTCEIIEESSQEEIEDSKSQVVVSRHEVMDECSRMDFSQGSNLMESFKNQVAADLVQESWKKLRNGHAALKQYVTSELTDAFKIVKLAHSMSDLISQADQLVSKSQKLDSFELSIICSELSDEITWFGEQPHMVDTILQDGFCYYSKVIDATGLKIGSQKILNSAEEMLPSTTSLMELCRLLGQDAKARSSSMAGSSLGICPSRRELSVESERKSRLFDAIKSVVPSRSYLALKGNTFHEYLSSLGCISRLEASRLGAGIKVTKRRRARGARHYLSSGALMLSPEDITLLDQYKFGKNFLSSITDTSFRDQRK
ncbi:hypothetical protein SLA2020_208190 [Shorea laevis]